MIRNTLPRRRGEGKFIGFWKTDDEPKEYIDPDWDSAERHMVIAYLLSGKVESRFRGHASCRVCGERNGSTDLTDGVWIWPEGLAHYLKEHGVRPPQEFVDHVLSKTIGKPKLTAMEMISDEKIREVMGVLGIDPESEVEAIDKLQSLRPAFERLESLFKNRDVVAAVHLREIIQHGCDLISYLGEDFDPTLLRGIFGTAQGAAAQRSDRWDRYTKDYAPIVNRRIIKENSPPGGKCDG